MAANAGPYILVVVSLLTAGCSTTQRQWSPTVDTYGNSRAQYLSRDLEECRSLAVRVSGDTGDAAVEGAITGGLFGAAAGAAIGAALGNAGRGAAVGAASMGMVSGAGRAGTAEREFKHAYVNCMRQRGHNVLN